MNKANIKNTIEILSNIDDKMILLHECSSDDFLTFNHRLKTYYSQAKTISENSTKIFELITGKTSLGFINQLEEFYLNLKNHAIAFEKQMTHSIQILEKTHTKLNLMFVPLNNLRQNITTLKFLDTNFKVNFNLERATDADNVSKASNDIHNYINGVKTVYPVINQEFIELKEEIKNSLNTLREAKDNNIISIETILFQVKSSINILSIKHKEAQQYILRFQTATSAYENSISKIITNLQYHDIIRQKMEHIQKTHKDIVQSLQGFDIDDEEEALEKEKMQIAFQIRDISSLQIAQLMQTNKEYQNAIQTISKKMLEIADELSTVSVLGLQLSGQTYKSDITLFGEVNQKLRNAVLILDKFRFAYQTLENESCRIDDRVETLSKNFNKLQDNDKNFEKYLNFVKGLRSSVYNNKQQIAFQIQNLLSDTNLIYHDLELLYNNTKEQTTKLRKYTKEVQNTISHKTTAGLQDTISTILVSLNKQNHSTSNLLDKNVALGQNISADIKQSVQQVKYYDFFEKIIDEIILKLNDLNQNILDSENTEDNPAFLKNIAKAKQNYTTQSEHLIHKQIIEDEECEIDLFDDDDSNLELF